MIKKVKTSALKPGAFIHDYLCDVSKENIHLEKSFLKDMQTINILLSWGIKEVLIDTERGIDIQPAKRAVPPTHPIQGDAQGLNRSSSKSIFPTPESFTEELKEAKEIKDDAVRFITDSMNQIVVGKFPDLNQIYSLVRRMQSSIERNRDALSLLTRVRKKDEYTLVHSISVSTLVLSMCKYKGIPTDHAEHLAIGALFHDIGKAEIDAKILNKPGSLNEHEFDEMKKHSRLSARVLRDISDLPLEVHDIALHHHENWDGTGYPDGLIEGEISFGAQLTAVCDIFDAVTSDRCYRNGLTPVEGLKIVYDLRGEHLNDEMALEFIRFMGVYPVGACVRLENGLVGIVVAPTDSMLKPFVKVFFDRKKQKRVHSYILNLAEEDIAIVCYEDPSSYKLSGDSMLKELGSSH